MKLIQTVIQPRKKIIYYRKWLINTCFEAKKTLRLNDIIYNPKKWVAFTIGEIKAKCQKSKICAFESCDGNPGEEKLNNSNKSKRNNWIKWCEDLQIQGPSKK